MISILLVLRKPSFAPVATSPEAGKSFDQKLQEMATAHQQGTPREIHITETELNSKLQEIIATGPTGPGGSAALRAASIHLEDDKFLGTFTVNVSGKDLYLTLGGRLGVNYRTLELTPTEVQMGSLPIPLSIVESTLRKRLNSPEFHEQMKLPDSIKGVRIENGEVVVQSQ